MAVNGGAIVTFDAAVTSPLALTVNDPTCVAEPHDPEWLLTVANVVTFEPALVVTSPVNAGN